ncbi:MAG: tetratricopeptide repeat protein [Gammaproteobacteria bacterium]|nr:tetratricopeptide repeat protein [Gammaproteobacteria bacterium]
MRREYVAMESAMREFIEQPDYPTLVINCSDADLAMPLAAVKSWDSQWPNHFFLLFPFECVDATSYLQKCMDALTAQIDKVNAQRTADGVDRWPPLPLLCNDARQPLPKRVRIAVEYVHRVASEYGDIVWIFCPVTISDVTGYKTLIAGLLALDGVDDWMEGHRFLVRDNRTQPFLLPELAREKTQNTLTIDVDFSGPKAADSLVKTINNPDIPVAERILALTQVAALDLAYKRYDQAFEKYALLHAYHVQQKDAVGQALALAGAGDVAMQRNQLEEARKRYQQSLAVAVPEKNLAVLLNLLSGAGECCLRLKEFAEAEGYFDFANRCAGKLVNLSAKIQSMEKLGLAQLGCRKTTEAIQTWRDAKDLCQRYDCIEQQESLLGHLIGVYRTLDMPDEVRKLERERTALAASPLRRDMTAHDCNASHAHGGHS